MLRFTLLALLLANAGYLAWSQGWMASLGWKPETPSEAFRFKQQIRPDAIQVGTPGPPVPSTPPATATAATPVGMESSTPATGPSRCWQAGPLSEQQANTLRTTLRNQEAPAIAWELQSQAVVGRWMVYMGKFPNTEAMELRTAELRQQGVAFDRAGGALEPGISLGRFPTEDAATRELTTMLRQGVRGARVVQERASSTLYTLRLPHVSPEMHPRLETLKPALADKPLQLCQR